MYPTLCNISDLKKYDKSFIGDLQNEIKKRRKKEKFTQFTFASRSFLKLILFPFICRYVKITPEGVNKMQCRITYCCALNNMKIKYPPLAMLGCLLACLLVSIM